MNAYDIGGAPGGFRRTPLQHASSAYKPGSVWRISEEMHVTAIPLRRRLPGA